MENDMTHTGNQAVRAIGTWRASWLAPAGTVVAMLTCYGVTAALESDSNRLCNVLL